MHTNQQIIRSFQIAELEERVEFKGWGGYVEGGVSQADGTTARVGITKKF
jgi:hypothetical protein